METVQQRGERFWTERDRRYLRRYQALAERDPASTEPLQPVFDSRAEADSMRCRLDDAAIVLARAMLELSPASSPSEFGAVRAFLRQFLLYVRAWEAGAYVYSHDLQAGYRWVGQLMTTDAFVAYNRERSRRFQSTEKYRTYKRGYDHAYRDRAEVKERRAAAAPDIAARERVRYHQRRLRAIGIQLTDARRSGVVDVDMLSARFLQRARRVFEELGLSDDERDVRALEALAEVLASVVPGEVQ